MVPVQTVFALLALLVLMSSCSQETPPHPGISTTVASQTTSDLNKPVRSDPPINAQTSPTPSPVGPVVTPPVVTIPGQSTETFVPLNASSGSINLFGSDAEQLFRLLPISSTPMPSARRPVSMNKLGNQINCKRDHVGYSCSFIVNYEDASIAEVVKRDGREFI